MWTSKKPLYNFTFPPFNDSQSVFLNGTYLPPCNQYTGS